MGGALQFDDPESSVDRLLDRLDSVLAEVLDDGHSVVWCVLLDQQNTVAVDDPDDGVLRFEVVGELQEQVPEEEYTVDEEGELRLPLFPRLSSFHNERIHYQDTLGYQEQLINTYSDALDIDDVTLSSQADLQKILDQRSDRNLTDAFGHSYSELNSVLANRLAERSLTALQSEEPIDIALSFDVFQTLILPYQYQDRLLFTLDENRDEQVPVPVEYVMSAEWITSDSFPFANTIYIHQHERARVSKHNFLAEDLDALLRGRMLSYDRRFTVPDPGDQGIPATFGSIVQADIDTSTGFFFASSEVDIQLVHTFWAALDVAAAPYLTPDVVQDTPEWFREDFPGWSNLGNGFSLSTADEHREINQRINVTGYWVVKGVNYGDKQDFRDDLTQIEDIVEAELGCDVERRNFNGTVISTSPIHQRDVVNQVVDEITAPPDAETLIETAAALTRRSTDVEGIDEPLYPSDLETFVADTSIVDAGVISTLIIDGQLYGATVLVPDVVLEEVHWQADQGRREGERGLEELEYLRALERAGFIDFEIVETDYEVTHDDVAADHTILAVAHDRGVPLCSDDGNLIRLAGIVGVTTLRLKQELSRPRRLIERVLGEQGEMAIVELSKAVQEQREELTLTRDSVSEQMFYTPADSPSGDLSEEVVIENLVNQMVHEKLLYRVDGRVGLIEDVCIVPRYATLANGKLSEAIEDGRVGASLSGPVDAYAIHVALPVFLREWAGIHSDQRVREELERLEALDQRHEIEIDESEPDLSYAEILDVGEDYVEQALNGLVARKESKFEKLFVLQYDSEQDDIIIEGPV